MRTDVELYRDIKGIDIEAERQRVGTYKVSYEEQVSREGIRSKYTRVMICKDGKWCPVGEISNVAPHIPYTEGMDWIVKGLKDNNYRFKLVKSVANYKRFDLYQLYAIDDGCITQPFPNFMATCIVVRMSYSRMPGLTVCFGTYQYNEDFALLMAARGKRVLTATRYTWQDMKESGFGSTFKGWASTYTDDMAFYEKLSAVPISAVASAFSNDMIPIYVRKRALGVLEGMGLKLNNELPELNGVRYKLLDDAAFHKYGNNIIQKGEHRFPDAMEITAWWALKILAKVSSNLSTPSRIMAAGRAVDRVFYEIGKSLGVL